MSNTPNWSRFLWGTWQFASICTESIRTTGNQDPWNSDTWTFLVLKIWVNSCAQGTLGVLDNLPQIPSLGLPYVISYMYSNVSSWSLQNVLYYQYKVAVQTALPFNKEKSNYECSKPSIAHGWMGIFLMFCLFLFVQIANHITSYTTDQKCFKRTSLLTYSRLQY